MKKHPLKLILINKNTFLPLLFILIFFTIVFFTTPIKQTFEYNPDEGINLIKTSLFQNGFSLYKEIWNDQPPLFTLILSFWLKIFGQSAYSARILILIFSSILLWALYQIIRIRQGHICAFIAITFLTSSTDYIPLSTSIMIGIPSLCLALLSILCVVSYAKNQSNYLMILSGAFMGLSLQTKFFSAFLIPIILLEIIQNKQLYLKKKKILSSIGLWLISLSVVYFFITLIFFNFEPQLFIKNLLQPHLLKSVFTEFKYSFLSKLILPFNDFVIIIFALTAPFLIEKQKKRQLFFPFLWLSFAFIILFIHRPVWRHHYLLISIPLCW
ncbi:MAG: glycosyltransferase family 39 protein, partial [Candidatus Omnitrophica bacterium]|nr:glycosyltransferase family 39 protein [Candidatus Omnitrophota bacterium]